MEILFVEIDTDKEWAVASLGPAFLGALARQKGHGAAMLRVAEEAPLDAVVARSGRGRRT
jgi:hypothetical protein